MNLNDFFNKALVFCFNFIIENKEAFLLSFLILICSYFLNVFAHKFAFDFKILYSRRLFYQIFCANLTIY